MYTAKKMLPYLLVCAIAIYIFPLFRYDKGSSIAVLLVWAPLTCFVVAILYGKKNKVTPIFSFFVGLLFFPTVFLYYNSSAWLYTIGYALVSLIGNLMGSIIDWDFYIRILKRK